MTTALTVLGDAEYDVLRNTICKELTKAELTMFGMICQRNGLDPFSGQICVTKRKSKGEDRMVVQIQVDGFRALAEDTGEYDGQEEPAYSHEPHEAKSKDDWHPHWARVVVYRRKPDGRQMSFSAKVYWSEFVQTKFDGTVQHNWRQMPYLMLAKCAEVQALRKAFPRKLGGIAVQGEPIQVQEDEAAPPARAAEVAAQLEAPKVPPAIAGKWNEATAAFSGLGVTAQTLLDYLGLETVAGLQEKHMDALRAYYTQLADKQAAQ